MTLSTNFEKANHIDTFDGLLHVAVEFHKLR